MADKILWHGKHLDGTLTVSCGETTDTTAASVIVTFIMQALDVRYVNAAVISPTTEGVAELLNTVTDEYLHAMVAFKTERELDGAYSH